MGWMVRGSNSSEGQDFPHLPRPALPAFYRMGIGSFLVVLRPGHGIDHPPSIAEFKERVEHGHTHTVMIMYNISHKKCDKMDCFAELTIQEQNTLFNFFIQIQQTIWLSPTCLVDISGCSQHSPCIISLYDN